MTNLVLNNHSQGHIALYAHWRSAEASHTEIRHFEKFNVWRDLEWLPTTLQRQILGQGAGYRAAQAFAAGELLPAWHQSLLHRVHQRHFRARTRRGSAIPALKGRFYPQGMVEQIPGVFSGNMKPTRLVDIAGDTLAFDFNHPLAHFPLHLEAEIVQIQDAGDEHGGRCNECVDELLQGPGMQARYRGQATDFWSVYPFSRADDHPDRLFYALPRWVQHLDQCALQELHQLYGRLLKGRGRVLDLMASWDSHLPEDLAPDWVAGLGLNQQELDHNPRLHERLEQDLNQSPHLCWDSNSVDAVICTASVEYLVQPLEVFREVWRILKPGGLFINTFTNRWFPAKAINLWGDLHEFERLGLVMEYYLQAGGYQDVHTWSQRGLPRPTDDRHFHISPWSDPLYAVWASKKAPA